MSGRRYRPKRRLRSEIFPLAVIMSLPLALYFAFPSGAVGFSPRRQPSVDRTYNAFVSLDAARESELLAAARSSWQSDPSSRREVRANLLDFGSGFESVPVASGIRPSVRIRPDPVIDYESDLLPEGVAAEALKKLTPEKERAPEPAFPESDLLKLN